MRILILSRRENVHADMVEAYCRNHAEVERINFDFDKQADKRMPKVICGTARNTTYDAVFIHHPRINAPDSWFEDDLERKLFIASWDSVKEWFEASYPQAVWVNRPSVNARNRNVLAQLDAAMSLGFAVPETLFTNSLDELRQFAGSKPVVIKQGNLGVHLEGKRILTSLINVDSLTEEMLQGCPCLFQPYIPKLHELRVHIIGNTVLTCKIDSQASESTRIDWRNYDLENTPHEAFPLEREMQEKCISLVRSLGLSFGIIDLIVNTANEYLFLECNAQGHWSWIENLTGLPITETLCRYLLNRDSE